jgi:hypothetical protein
MTVFSLSSVAVPPGRVPSDVAADTPSSRTVTTSVKLAAARCTRTHPSWAAEEIPSCACSSVETWQSLMDAIGPSIAVSLVNLYLI